MNSRLRTFAWASFDLANTIFSFNILSLYFPLWVIQDLGGSDLSYSLAVSLSLLAAGVVMPFLGALSDHLKKRMGFLISCTLLCVVCTALLPLAPSLTVTLLLFGVAHAMYQLGLIFYDAMLPQVSEVRHIGRTSGFGISLGYVGTLLGLILVQPFVAAGGRQAAFLPTASLFLLFSLPCFWGMRDSPTPPVDPFSPLHEGLRRFREGMRYFQSYPSLRGLLWVYFFAFLGIQPVVYFMSVYAQKVIGLDNRELFYFFLIATSFTILGSYLLGLLTDRIGPKWTLGLSLGGWIVGLSTILICPDPLLFFGVGSLIGVSMGGSWLSLRVLGVTLAPQAHLGQVLGFLGFFARIASVLGTLFWGLTTRLLRAYEPLNYRIALGGLVLFLATGLFCLVRKIPGDP